MTAWWQRLGTRARVAAISGAALVLVLGAGTAFALSGGGSDEEGDVSARPSASASASAEATEDTETADDVAIGRDEADSAATAATGTIVVTVATDTGGRPIESGVAATGVDTGRHYDSGMVLDRPSHTLRGVAPGRYVVSAGSDDDDWEAAWYGQTNPVEGDRSQAKVVTVEPGQTVRVTVTLIFWPCAEPPGTYDGCGTSTEPPPSPTPSAATATPRPTTTPSATP